MGYLGPKEEYFARGYWNWDFGVGFRELSLLRYTVK